MLVSTVASWRSALMVEIHFKTFLAPAAASSWAATTARSAPTGAVRLLVVQAWSGNSGGFIAAMVNLPFRRGSLSGCAGEWPAITVAPAKAGALTTVNITLVRTGSVSATDSSDLARRRHHALCRPHRQALTLRPRYSGTAPSRDTDEQRRAIHRNALQQFANERFLFFQFCY